MYGISQRKGASIRDCVKLNMKLERNVNGWCLILRQMLPAPPPSRRPKTQGDMAVARRQASGVLAGNHVGTGGRHRSEWLVATLGTTGRLQSESVVAISRCGRTFVSTTCASQWPLRGGGHGRDV